MNRMELARSVYLAYAKAEKGELDVEWTASLMGGDSDNAHGVKIALAMYDARQAEIDEAVQLIRDIYSGKIDVLNSERGMNIVGEFLAKQDSLE